MLFTYKFKLFVKASNLEATTVEKSRLDKGDGWAEF